MIRLDRFDNSGFDRGRSRVIEMLWILALIPFASSLPGSGWRVLLLRWFGARIGAGAVIKPRVRIKFPWRLDLGEHVWIGESVWIDNLAQVSCGSHVCISQGVYICTGNHRFDREGFDLETRAVSIGAHSWLGAFCRVAPGCVVHSGTRTRMGSVLAGEIGVPAIATPVAPT